EGVRTSGNGYAEFTLSRNGTLFYGRGGASMVRFGWRERSGKLLERIGEPVLSFLGFSLSPDGARVAFTVGPSLAQTEVWVMDLARGLPTRVTFNKGVSPRWAPDGKSLYYNNSSGLFRKPADGSGDEVLLMKAGLADRVNT